MKTLILSGSPHKNGDSMTLLEETRKNLEGDVDLFEAYYANISPCFDCRHCWKYDSCSIEDGMQHIHENINTYDNIIIVSPLYFAELTGPLLSLISRFQLIFAAKRFRGEEMVTKEKRGAIIFTGGSGWGLQKAEETALFILDSLKAKCVGKVYSLKTDKIPASDDAVALEAARQLAVTLSSPAE